MKPDEILNDAFLSKFKNTTELTQFLEGLHKRGIEKILEGELDAHLDYPKNEKRADSNVRNGYTSKKLKTTLGETTIQVPRDRESSFNPMLIKKRQNTADCVENIINFFIRKRNDY